MITAELPLKRFLISLLENLFLRGLHSKSFNLQSFNFETLEEKARRLSSPLQHLTFELDRRIMSLDPGVEYYSHGDDIRYSHKDVQPLPSGRRHPFVHISPQDNVLIVHIDKAVVDPDGVTKLRVADSSFLKQFDLHSISDLSDYNLGLIRQSFQIFSRKYRRTRG